MSLRPRSPSFEGTPATQDATAVLYWLLAHPGPGQVLKRQDGSRDGWGCRKSHPRGEAHFGGSARLVATDLLPDLHVVKADPTDNIYLATTLAGGARWVVSGNTRPLTPLDGYAGKRTVEPAVFLAELDAQTCVPTAA